MVEEHFRSLSPKKPKPSQSKEVLEFINYNDDVDYMLLIAKKGRTHYSFINDNNDKRDLLRGDLVEIQWKEDTIYIAGDGETPELAEWVVSIQKVKNGSLSNFRKAYKRPIHYSWCEECDFTPDFQTKLQTLTEYYLANSGNESLKSTIRNQEDLVCSFEKRDRNGREFIAISISNKEDTGSIQWLYYSLTMDMLFEADQSTNKLRMLE